jgi:DNA (cytosine-5)-methyltransferase 1
MRPRLLDLFCGAGGCSVGYERAGFDVVGVDIMPQPNYPFEFVQADALEYLHEYLSHGASRLGVTIQFDAIHASPPCQAYSVIKSVHPGKEHPALIDATRELLGATGLPWVIENVGGAKDELRDPVMLCGSMFDPPLDVQRHRLFETNWPLDHPTWGCRHKVWAPRYDVYEHGKWRKASTVPVYGHGGGKANAYGPSAMQVDWMTRAELVQAIPPVYTEFIGAQLIKRIYEQSSNEAAA